MQEILFGQIHLICKNLNHSVKLINRCQREKGKPVNISGICHFTSGANDYSLNYDCTPKCCTWGGAAFLSLPLLFPSGWLLDLGGGQTEPEL